MKVLSVLLLCTASAVLMQAQIPTVYIAGDSTANNTDHQGWGDHFAKYIDQTKANVVNRARGGRSARTFMTEGLWDALAADLKPGDYVLIQFGHNDGSAPDKDRARGDLPGIGDEAQEFTLPDGKKELVHTFGWYLRRFVADTVAKGAHPIMFSCTVRNIWTDGKVERGPGHFGDWSKEAATTAKIPFVDVTAALAGHYQEMGPEKMKALFPIDHTHTNQQGADLVASVIADAMKQQFTPGLFRSGLFR